MKDIKKIIEGECPSCLKRGLFVYQHLQKSDIKHRDELDHYEFLMYECKNCESTLSYEAIEGHNMRLRYMKYNKTK